MLEIHKQVSQFWLLDFDVLNSAVMGKKKTLSDFDKCQIFMAKKQDQILSEMSWFNMWVP